MFDNIRSFKMTINGTTKYQWNEIDLSITEDNIEFQCKSVRFGDIDVGHRHRIESIQPKSKTIISNSFKVSWGYQILKFPL